MKVLKKIRRPSPESDAARRQIKLSSTDVLRSFPIKQASVTAGQLTLVKSNALRCEAAVQQPE